MSCQPCQGRIFLSHAKGYSQRLFHSGPYTGTVSSLVRGAIVGPAQGPAMLQPMLIHWPCVNHEGGYLAPRDIRMHCRWIPHKDPSSLLV